VKNPEELRRASIGAARDARALVAPLGEHARIGRHVPKIVADLFTAEIGELPKLYAALEAAMKKLRETIDLDANDERSSRALSRAMALLHPVVSELARSLGIEREEITAPFLLASTRVKPSAPPGEDDRRIDLRLEVEVDVGIEGEHTFFTGRTGDLSKGGLFVATDEPLSVGTELLLSFLLPDGYRVLAEAVVAWVRVPRYRPDELPAGMGLRFLELSAKDAHAIAHFLRVRPAFRYGD
jgi:uncharacterized protein (TIGR02266 family)